MTTWPPRFSSAVVAMQVLLQQRQEAGLEQRVHPVLVLSEEEICASEHRRESCHLMRKMEDMGVELIIDKGNIRSHKKLMPTLERYLNNPILCVDDDNRQAQGWLRTFVRDHDAHSTDIIYAQGCSRISVKDGIITENRDSFCIFLLKQGQITTNIKPGSGAILYPAHTFTDPRFFDRDLYMSVCPSDDETWQWAFAKIAGKTYRLLSACNIPASLGARQDCSLWNINRDLYTKTHNLIAAAIPEYLEVLTKEADH